MDSNEFTARLCAAIQRMVPSWHEVSALRRLSSGASQELWAFDAHDTAGATTPLILRRSAQAGSTRDRLMAGFSAEAAAMAAAGDHGVPVPQVYGQLDEADGLGKGLIMHRLEGETLPPRILRDEAFAALRPKLANECGKVLARLHRVKADDVSCLPDQSARSQLRQLRADYEMHGESRPVFVSALCWLETHLPRSSLDSRLVHGDFRNGNLMIGPDGIRGVLDWELTHVGDPMEDLGWLCVNSWRFGQIDRPVGGFGLREDLFVGYRAEGGQVDEASVHFWEVLGTLKWGIFCQGAAADFVGGVDRSIERAAIGRRASETELDLLRLLYPRTGK